MAVHGHPWLYKVTHDGEWTDRVTLACVWVCVVLGDEEWSGMLRCACAWPYIVLHGSEWSHVVTRGHTWSHMAVVTSNQVSVPTAWGRARGATSSQLQVQP